MGKLDIKYFGMLSVKLNLHTEEINFEAERITVAELVEVLKEKHCPAVQDYLQKGYNIYVQRDGKTLNILNIDKHDTQLQDGDRVIFNYIFAGG